MGNVLRGRHPFTKRDSSYGSKKFKSQLLSNPSDPSIRSREHYVSSDRKSPVYDPNPPRCYEWSKIKELPPEGPPTPPPPRLVRSRTGDGITGPSQVYENVVLKVCTVRKWVCLY